MYVWAPVVVTVPPLIAVVPAASVVTDVNAVPPPTAPVNVVVPLSLTVKVCAPFTVWPNVTFTPVNVAFAPNVTTSLYVWAPVVVIPVVLIAVVPAASVVTDVNAVFPPTIPPKVVVPLSFTVKVCPPFTVLANVTFTPVNAAFAPNVTASLYVWAPVVVIPVVLIAVVPAASVVTDVNGVTPPTTPPNVVVPAVFTARVWALFTVPPNVMFPAPVLVKVGRCP